MSADKSRTGGTKIVSTKVPNPPQVGGVKAVPGAVKRRLRTIGIVAKRATKRVSVGRRALIPKEPDRVGVT